MKLVTLIALFLFACESDFSDIHEPAPDLDIDCHRVIECPDGLMFEDVGKNMTFRQCYRDRIPGGVEHGWGSLDTRDGRQFFWHMDDGEWVVSYVCDSRRLIDVHSSDPELDIEAYR